MNEVTTTLHAIGQGDPRAAAQLLPLVYDALRRLAAEKLAQEKPGQTLQATALVHEAYLRLVGDAPDRPWDSRGHFFAAAAEAIRRILIENARRHDAHKRGGRCQRVELPDLAGPASEDPVDLLALDEALCRFEELHPQKAQLVKLRYFAGCSLAEAAAALSLSRATVRRHWAFARAWLFGQLHPG
jgi:RNA polymerase sigma factor (TIGR02999 family)